MEPLSALRDRFAQPEAVDQQYQQLLQQALQMQQGRKSAALPDVGAPLIGDGGQFSEGSPWANKAADIGGQLAFDLFVPQTPSDYALMSLGPLGKLPKAAKIALVAGGFGLDPSDAQAAGSKLVKYGEQIPKLVEDAFHHFSKLRTGKPEEEMAATIKNAPSFERPLVKPEDLQGKEIIFTPGDRTMAGGTLTHVGDTKLRRAIPMEGGPDYPFLHGDKPVPGAEDMQRMWANSPQHSTALINTGNEIMERGRDPVLMYLPMSKRALDSSKQMTMPAIDLAKQGSMSNEAAQFINQTMADKGFTDFPGFRAKYDRLVDWADHATGKQRAALVKALDTKPVQIGGGPDIGELRYALTDARLRDTPSGSPGLTVSRFDPRAGRVENSLSSTYETATAGPKGGSGTLGTSVPWHIAARDMHEALMRINNPTKFAERPDYHAAKMPIGLPRTQVADQQWVDMMSDWLRKNPQGW